MSTSTNPKRTKRLPETRVSEQELHTIKAKAQKAGLSQSEYNRRALLNSVVKVRTSPVDIQAVRQLSVIGSNLNQLVKHAHITRDVDVVRLNEVLANIDTIIMGIVNDT